MQGWPKTCLLMKVLHLMRLQTWVPLLLMHRAHHQATRTQTQTQTASETDSIGYRRSKIGRRKTSKNNLVSISFSMYRTEIDFTETNTTNNLPFFRAKSTAVESKIQYIQ
mmetsp:Transcript_25327/g.52649  ORF Transcript_25327/g.52649 Transcript_25327/m.52649 type:complete len:110 (-) Transcript_25327:2724-3053(-)